jgi:hypothetical protein
MKRNATPLRTATTAGLRHALIGALACITSGSFACAGEDLDRRDLGNSSNLLTSDDDPTASDRSPVIGPDGAIDSFIEGHWVGHAENPFASSGPDGSRPTYAFPSGSTDITLDLSLADPTFPTGQIVFGAGSVPEPLASVVYPPGFVAQAWVTSGSAGVPLAPLEGFVYPLYEAIMRTTGDVGLAAGALSVGYAPNAAYEEWCALQTPRPTGDGRFDCLTLSASDDPTALCSSGGPDGPTERFDCNLYNLCGADNVCRCTETECAIAPVARTLLWIVRDDDDLLATLAGATFDYGSPARFMPVGMVRFQRAID